MHIKEVQGLATHQQFNRQHRLQFFGNLVSLDDGVVGEADQILLVAAGRETVDRGGERQRLHFRVQASRRVLKDHVPAVKARVAHQERRHFTEV